MTLNTIKVPRRGEKHVQLAIEWLMRSNQLLSRFLQVLLTNSDYDAICDTIITLKCRTCDTSVSQPLEAREYIVDFAYDHRNHKIVLEADLTTS